MPRAASARVVDALSTGRGERPGSIAVIVAHPDDEVVGAGGRLAYWAAETTVVHVTGGAPADGADARRAGFTCPGDYADARRRETRAALACLPHQPIAVVSLGFTDQRVTRDLYDVVSALRELMRRQPPDVVVTHAYEGGHPDHDAIAFAHQMLRAMPDLPRFDVVEFAEYHEGRSGALVTNQFADTAEPDGRVASALTPQDRRRTQLMLKCFRTQQRVLEPFGCGEEWLRPAPRYDFTKPPEAGGVWFDRFDWITSARWRAIVAQVASRLAADGVTC
jgi:LmbE family N-acetylglucosaminyl deacetylase